MGMAVFVVHRAGVLTFDVSVEREISGTEQGILHALRPHSPELVGEAEIHVIPEPGFIRAVVLHRVERLHDVLVASIAELGRLRQVVKVNQQVLRPILQILFRREPVRVVADPTPDVIGKPLVELPEVSRDNKPVASDVSAIFDREGIGLVRLLFHRQIGEINGLIFY